MVLIEFDPYINAYVNVDQKPYYATASCVVIPSLDLGSHELLLIDKNSQEKSYLELNIMQLPAYFKLTKSLTGYKLIAQELSSESYAKYIESITIKADSIYKEPEEQDIDCVSYNETEMDFVRRSYIKASDKKSYLTKTFRDKCLSKAQLQELLLSSLTTKDKYVLVETVHDKVNPKLALEEVSTYFQDTDYYSDFLRLKAKHGR